MSNNQKPIRCFAQDGLPLSSQQLALCKSTKPVANTTNQPVPKQTASQIQTNLRKTEK